jgi:RHS repeat-associated protein
VQSIDDGAYDRLSWDPLIEYLDVPGETIDENGRDQYRYKASEDFTFAGRTARVFMPISGMVSVTGNFSKSCILSDNCTITVKKISDGTVSTEYSRVVPWDDVSAVFIDASIHVKKKDYLEFKIDVDSRIDTAEISWEPVIAYTSADDPDVELLDQDGNPTIVFHPFYDMDLYPESNLISPQTCWEEAEDGILTVEPSVTLSPSAITEGINGEIVIIVKKQNGYLSEPLYKTTIHIVNGVPFVPAFEMETISGGKYFFDFCVKDADIACYITGTGASAYYPPPVTTPPTPPEYIGLPSARFSARHANLKAEEFRGWACFAYNGNGKRAEEPIDEDLLVIDENYGRDEEDNPKPRYVYIMYPSLVEDNSLDVDKWKSEDENCWVTDTMISSSRNGEDHIALPDISGGSGAVAVPRSSYGVQGTIGGGYEYASATLGEGTTYGTLDYMDLNGDRFPDVVSNSGIQYTLPTGGLTEKSPVSIGDARSTSNTAFSFGGSIPIIQPNGRGMVNGVITGGIFDSMPITFGLKPEIAPGFSETNYDLMDINGDGLTDRVTKTAGGIEVEYNLGYGFSNAETWGGAEISSGFNMKFPISLSLGFYTGFYSFGGGLNLGGNYSKVNTSLMDINGDGLADYIYSGTDDEGNNHLMVMINTGAGFADAVQWTSLNPTINRSESHTASGGIYFTIPIYIPIPFTPGFSIIINPGLNASYSFGKQTLSIRDINGDGLPDIANSIKSTYINKLSVWKNQTGRTNLLKKVTRPLGAVTGLDYIRTGNTYCMPQSKWVLSKTTVFDGLAGDGVDTQVKRFEYEEGKYDRLEREFYGFRIVRTEQLDAENGNSIYLTVERNYLNDSFYTKGMLEREIIRDGDGRTYTEILNTYTLIDTETQGIFNDQYPFNMTATVFPQLTRTDKNFYEGENYPGVTTYTTFDYDELGNVTEFFDAGGYGYGDDVHAEIEYHKDSFNYIVGKPKQMRVYDSSNRLLREREGEYEYKTGNLMELVETIDSRTEAITILDYYPNGNLKKITGSENEKGQRYTITYQYDPEVSTHITRVQDSFGLFSESTYNYLYGVEYSSKDTNNNQMSRTYDTYGRLITVKAPYDISNPCITFEYYHSENPPRAVTHNKIHFDTSYTEAIDTVIVIDGLKRVIQTKKEGEVLFSGRTSPTYGMNVTGKVLFDLMGRVCKQGQPVFQTGYNAQYNSSVPLKNPTINEYDILGRTTRVKLPDGSTITNDYSTYDDLFKTTVTDPLGNDKISYTDPRENIVRVDQFNNSRKITTTYEYNPVKEITRITDTEGNVTTIGYDLLGRRISIDSPDAGLVENTYDPAGNLIKKVDPNLREERKSIKYDYDYNRLTKITYPGMQDVQYFYGVPGEDFNRAGRLKKIADESGTTEYFYGRLGEETKTIKTQITLVQGSNPTTTTTQYQYDYLGRMEFIEYPDGEKLYYVYDRGGKIKRVYGTHRGETFEYVKNIYYDEFGQRVFIKYGNNTTTQYTYDPCRRWLKDIDTKNKNGKVFQDVTYAFDRVGNVLGVNNTGYKPVKQEYGYDDLYQLTSANGTYTYAGKTDTYDQMFEYDDIGNFTHKVSHNHRSPGHPEPSDLNYNFVYKYENSGKPHQATRIGGWLYDYDYNGNTTAKYWLAKHASHSDSFIQSMNNSDFDSMEGSGWLNSEEDEGDNNPFDSESEGGSSGKEKKPKKEKHGKAHAYGHENKDKHGVGIVARYRWDEENRMKEAETNGRSTYFIYDASGERTIKRGQGGETLYVNKFFQLQNKDTATKHIFVGSTRIVSKLSHFYDMSGDLNYEKKNVYFYHPDHLGSTTFVSDSEGNEYEHLEYTPYGETWSEEVTNPNIITYKFTSKELDEETGLYYFGARYLDPATGRWMSTDPALEKYLPVVEKSEGDRERNNNLPSQGEVYNPLNMMTYHYASNNPSNNMN